MQTQGTAPRAGSGADGAGLLDLEETTAVLRRALGDGVREDQIRAAAAAIKVAEEARWEALPPGINPDMGYNFDFLSCTETCWLGRQVLIEGATFRVFRLRE
jgi:hypothetical protein